MKKTIVVFLIFVLIFALIPDSGTPARAEDNNEEIEKEIKETVSGVLDGVDLGEFEAFFQELKDEYGIEAEASVKETIKKIINGEETPDARYFLQVALSLLVGNVGGYLAQASVILIICLLLSILKNMTSGFGSNTVKNIVYVACYGVVTVVTLALTTSTIGDVTKGIQRLTTFIDIAFPPLLTVMTALGSVTASGLYQPALAIVSSVVANVVSYFVLPGFTLCIALTIVGHINEEIKLGKFVKTIRSAVEWILSIVFGLFTTITTAKGIAGSGMDTLAIRSAKYALSGYVPIVGNYLKDGFDIVVSSCVIVKNAVGVTAVLILILTVLSPLIKILLTMFTLRLTAALAEPFGETRVPAMLCQIADCMRLLIVSLLCVAFTLFVTLMLVILSCNGGVL